MGLPTLKQFNDFVIEVFQPRQGKKQKPTAALGFLKNQRGLYAVIQKGAVSDDHYQKMTTHWEKKGWDIDITRSGVHYTDFDDGESDEEEEGTGLIDASSLAETKRKKGERTGFHAEMIVVSAMISANNWKKEIKTLDDLKALVQVSGGAMISANAPACKHCGNFMATTGIEYPGPPGEPTLTGWWNPVLDVVYPHSSKEFGKRIPGSAD